MTRSALAKAEKLDKQPVEGRGPLFGLPIGLKDNIVTKGTTQLPQVRC